MNPQHAKKYFREHLAVGDYCAVRTADYYAEKNRLTGEWFGEGAARLKLRGVIGEAAVLALCVGNDPGTGKWLTLRRNAVRRSGGMRLAKRRVFYDFIMSPPKSVSFVGLLHKPRRSLTYARALSAPILILSRRSERMY